MCPYGSIYDIQRAVEDKATVPIYYESRLAKLELSETEKPKIDADFEEVTEGEETERRENLKMKWAALEAVVGTEKRIGTGSVAASVGVGADIPSLGSENLFRPARN